MTPIVANMMICAVSENVITQSSLIMNVLKGKFNVACLRTTHVCLPHAGDDSGCWHTWWKWTQMGVKKFLHYQNAQNEVVVESIKDGCQQDGLQRWGEENAIVREGKERTGVCEKREREAYGVPVGRLRLT